MGAGKSSRCYDGPRISKGRTMTRPRGITLLAVFYWAAATVLLLACAFWAMRGPRPGEVFGAPVGATTVMYFQGLSAVVFLYLGHAFWHGIRTGYHVYIALKVAGWIVMIAGGLGAIQVGALAVEAGILAYVVKHQDWFRA